jgi:UDP-glucose 4-epimerase
LIVKGLKGKFPPLAQPDIARDYIFSEDVTKAYLFITSSDARLTPGEVFNVGTGIQTPLREVIAITKEIFQINTQPVWGSMENRAWDTDLWVSNNAKLCAAGWKPENDFRTGYLKTIEWFKENREIVEEIYRRI